MKQILWLDDIRNPFINLEKKVPTEDGSLVWVRSYDEFTYWITTYGLPDIISFDHDLADEHYDYNKERSDNDLYIEKTGMDCAKWLVSYCMLHNQPMPITYVHSANPVGADNIRYLINNYKKHVELN